ncbi:hypothetical protein ISCGN_012244 [Ixodes scapularis]
MCCMLHPNLKNTSLPLKGTRKLILKLNKRSFNVHLVDACGAYLGGSLATLWNLLRSRDVADSFGAAPPFGISTFSFLAFLLAQLTNRALYQTVQEDGKQGLPSFSDPRPCNRKQTFSP